MVGITLNRGLRLFALVLITHALTGCVSTEALYAEYDAADCVLVVTENTVVVEEKDTGSQLPWEPAVYFEYDSAELSAEEIQRLSVSIYVLKQYRNLGLSLQGFTDSLGNANYNLRLATRRIAAVKEYLQQQGIADDRIYLQPIGKALKQIDKDDAQTHAINRRVELMLLDSNGRPLVVHYAVN